MQCVEAGRLSFGDQETLGSPSFPVRGKRAVWGISGLGQRFCCGHLLEQVEVNKGFIEARLSDWSLRVCACVCLCVRVCVRVCVCVLCVQGEAAVTDSFSISSLLLFIIK